MLQKLLIESKPYYQDIAAQLGYDIDNGDINEEHVLHQQGTDTEMLEFEPGVRFKVDEQVREVTIITNGNKYKPLCKLEYESFTEDFDCTDDTIELGSGEYYFHEDGITIELIKYLPEYDEGFEDDDIEEE